MTLEEAEQTLRKMQHLSVSRQLDHRDEACEAFTTFWQSHPSREHFASLTRGLVLQSDMLWDMSFSLHGHLEPDA